MAETTTVKVKVKSTDIKEADVKKVVWLSNLKNQLQYGQ